MKGLAEKLQPEGQDLRDRTRLWRNAAFRWVLPTFAIGLVALPFNRGGLWDPYELRIAEQARQLAHQLFGAEARMGITEGYRFVSAGELGQGELGITSSAVGFALFGVSDWAGRCPSLFWGALTIASLWAVMGRFAGAKARGLGVLLLASTPFFAWQSRSMLGDAATIGSFALATTGLAMACFDDPSSSRPRSWHAVAYWGAAVLGLAAGFLCRGLLIGVAVPSLSVGGGAVLTLAGKHREKRRTFASWTVLWFGIAAAAFGLRELWAAQPGFSLLLGTTIGKTHAVRLFDVAFGQSLHQTFPLSTLLPVAAFAALKPSRAPEGERSLVVAFGLSIILDLAAATALASRADVLPLAAVAPVAGLCALGLARLHRNGQDSVSAYAIVITLAVLLFADFINLPDKVLLLTGIGSARVPEQLLVEGYPWLRMTLGIVLVGACFCLLGQIAGTETSSLGARYRRVITRIREAFDGQLINGFVLLETALITTALLQHAHDKGWIAVPVFDSARTLVGPIVSWAWLGLPVALFVAPFVYVTILQVAAWTVTPTGKRSRLDRHEPVSWRATRLPRWMVVQERRPSPGAILGGTIVLAGLVMSLGHAPALAEQLSPKRSIQQYRAHAMPGEPIALLGVKPESVGYYLGATPESFDAIEKAVQWLATSDSGRRWVTFPGERLAEVNAAYREAAGRNIVMVDPIASNVLLATNRVETNERDYNPLSQDVLSLVPPLRHPVVIGFGDFARLVGWDIKDGQGRSTTRLAPGRRYELSLAFEIFGTTITDWQVFVHIDGRGRRHNGDHDPVRGRYPSTLWQPRDVIIDRHDIVLERGALTGEHVVYVGLFNGNRRLEVTSGPQEDNRVRLGEIEVF